MEALALKLMALHLPFNRHLALQSNDVNAALVSM
jgi:hypothetical protein